MILNSRQKLCVWMGLALMVASAAYPPWVVSLPTERFLQTEGESTSAALLLLPRGERISYGLAIVGPGIPERPSLLETAVHNTGRTDKDSNDNPQRTEADNRTLTAVLYADRMHQERSNWIFRIDVALLVSHWLLLTLVTLGLVWTMADSRGEGER